MERSKVIIKEYDPEWPRYFEKIKSVLEKHLADDIITIEHVGSTSVEGLPAKAVIDMDIVVENDDDKMGNIIQKLEAIGYTHYGDFGIAGREVFKLSRDKLFEGSTLLNFPKHNLYACKKDNVGLKNHLALRDYLRGNPEAKTAYGNLKKELAEKHIGDIDGYTIGKTDFIANILLKCGFDKVVVDDIVQQNKS